MYPVLFKINFLNIYTYGFLVALGIIVGFWLAVKAARDVGMPLQKIIDLYFYSLVAGLIGAKLFFVLINHSFYWDNPFEIMRLWEGGLVFYGGLLFAVPTAYWFAKKSDLNVWEVADILAPAIAAGHAIGRIGCFCAGCCYGKPAEGLLWSVTFTDSESLAIRGVALHPVQLYESAGEFINLLFLLFLKNRSSFKGQLFSFYILNYSLIRFTTEWFRGDEVRGFIFKYLSISQGFSVLMFISSCILLNKLKKREYDLHKENI